MNYFCTYGPTALPSLNFCTLTLGCKENFAQNLRIQMWCDYRQTNTMSDIVCPTESAPAARQCVGAGNTILRIEFDAIHQPDVCPDGLITTGSALSLTDLCAVVAATCL